MTLVGMCKRSGKLFCLTQLDKRLDVLYGTHLSSLYLISNSEWPPFGYQMEEEMKHALIPDTLLCSLFEILGEL